MRVRHDRQGGETAGFRPAASTGHDALCLRQGSKPKAKTAQLAGLVHESPARACGRRVSRQELKYPLFQDGIIQAHSPLEQSLPDRRGEHAVERQAIENERAI